jgi:hypothetical protein
MPDSFTLPSRKQKGMKLTFALASCFVAASLLIPPVLNGTTAQAADSPTTWTTLPAGPTPANNPLAGFVPYAGEYKTMPYSMEWFYLPVSSVMTGPNTYDWSALESQLNASASRGHQAVFRFYLDYPGQKSGVPAYLLDQGITTHSYNDYDNGGKSVSPNYDDPKLVEGMEKFIASFGAKYDGDSRIGFIQMGLLGYWGEWHTYPHEDWFASSATQQRVLTAYTKAFTKTKLQVRYPDGANSSLAVGYHDDSFGTQTLAGTGWHFMDRVQQAGIANKWLTQPIGGELRPEVQNCIFEAPMVCPVVSSTDKTDFAGSVKASHASWLLNNYAFETGYTGQELTNAKAAAQSMGYKFQATSFSLTPTADPVKNTLSVNVKNTGVAPFYYDWPVKIVAVDSTGKMIRQWGPSWKLTDVKPGSTVQWRATISSEGMPSGDYTLIIRPINPLPNGVPLKFANANQDTTKAGWLTLGRKSLVGK